MSKHVGSPNGIERRAFRAADATLSNLPSADANLQVGCREGLPYKEIADPQYLSEILQAQIDLAMERGYPLCLALLRFTQPDGTSSCTQALVHRLGENLRPTDIVLLCPGPTIGLILHEADIEGGRRVCDRLKYTVSQTAGLSEIKLDFGLSDRVTREPSRGASMLRSAERSVEHR
jgi:hypothetical protein